MDYNHSIIQQALYPLTSQLSEDSPPQFAPQATLAFRLFDPTPMEIAPYVDDENILNLLCYDKQFANHSAFSVPNPKSAQAVKNLLLRYGSNITSYRVLTNQFNSHLIIQCRI